MDNQIFLMYKRKMEIVESESYCYKFNKIELGDIIKIFVVNEYIEKDYNYYLRYFGEKKYKHFKKDCYKIMKNNYNLVDKQNWGIFIRDLTSRVRRGDCLKQLNNLNELAEEDVKKGILDENTYLYICETHKNYNDMFKDLNFGFDSYTIFCYKNKIILSLIPDEFIMSDCDSD